MRIHRFQRARLSTQAQPDAAGRITVVLQLCGHDHEVREGAARCPSGGDLVYNFERGLLELAAPPGAPFK